MKLGLGEILACQRKTRKDAGQKQKWILLKETGSGNESDSDTPSTTGSQSDHDHNTNLKRKKWHHSDISVPVIDSNDED